MLQFGRSRGGVGGSESGHAVEKRLAEPELFEKRTGRAGHARRTQAHYVRPPVRVVDQTQQRPAGA